MAQNKPIKKKTFKKIENAKVAKKLVEQTHFTNLEIGTLIKIFRKSCKGAVMKRTEFIDFLHNTLNMTDEYFMERVFVVTDLDSDGQIQFGEFIASLSIMLRGTIEEKIKFCFTAFDVNEDMHLTREVICMLLKQSFVNQEEDSEEGILDMVEIFMKRMNTKSDNFITFEEYKAAVEEDPLILEVFGQVLPDDKSSAAILAMFSETHPLLHTK